MKSWEEEEEEEEEFTDKAEIKRYNNIFWRRLTCKLMRLLHLLILASSLTGRTISPIRGIRSH